MPRGQRAPRPHKVFEVKTRNKQTGELHTYYLCASCLKSIEDFLRVLKKRRYDPRCERCGRSEQEELLRGRMHSRRDKRQETMPKAKEFHVRITACISSRDIERDRHRIESLLDFGSIKDAFAAAGIDLSWIGVDGSVPANSPWQDDHVQFPRLIAEISAALSETEHKVLVRDLATSMDLSVDQVIELFDRAEKAWEAIKPEPAGGKS